MKTTKAVKVPVQTYRYIESRAALGFETDQEYFDYIDQSWTNGQGQQALELFVGMDIQRKNYFFNQHTDLRILIKLLKMYALTTSPDDDWNSIVAVHEDHPLYLDLLEQETAIEIKLTTTLWETPNEDETEYTVYI